MAELKVNVDVQGYNGLEQLESTMHMIDRIAGKNTLYFATQEARKAFLGLVEQAQSLEQQMSKTKDSAQLRNLTAQLKDTKEQLSQYTQASVYGGKVLSGKFSDSVKKAATELQTYKQLVAGTEQEIDNLGHKLATMTGKETNYKALSAQMVSLRTNLTQYKNNVNVAQESLNSLKAAQSAFGVSSVRAGGSMSEFIRQLQQIPTVGQQAQMSLRNLKGMAGDLGYALIGGLGLEQLTQRIFNTRSQFQQLEVAFNTMLGDTGKAKTLMGQLIDTAAKTPFSMSSITEGAKQLLAYGTDAKEVNDILVHLGDIAAGLNIPLSQLVYLYGTTMTQGRMYTMDLRQFMGRGIPMAEELAKQFGVSKEEVGKLVTDGKVGAENVKKAIIDMTAEGGKFGGLMEKQSHTLQGRWSNIGDTIDQMFNEIGKSSEGIFNSALDFISFMIDHWKTLGKIIGTVIAAVGSYKAALMIAATVQKQQMLGGLNENIRNSQQTISGSKGNNKGFFSVGNAQKSIRDKYLQEVNDLSKDDESVRARGKELEDQGILNKGLTEEIMNRREIARQMQEQADIAKEQAVREQAHSEKVKQDAEIERQQTEDKKKAAEEELSAEKERQAAEAKQAAENSLYNDRRDLTVASYRNSYAKRNVKSTADEYRQADLDVDAQQQVVNRMQSELGDAASLDPMYQGEIEKLNQLMQKREEAKNAYLAAVEQQKTAYQSLLEVQNKVNRQEGVQKAAAEETAAKATYESDKADLEVQQQKLETIKAQIEEEKGRNISDIADEQGVSLTDAAGGQADKISELESQYAEQQKIVDDTSAKTEESYQKMTDAHNAWVDACTEGVDKQEAQADAAEDVSEKVEEQVDAIKEATSSEEENATAKDSNTMASESNSTAQDTENVSKATGTTENSTNAMSESEDATAKDANSLASDTSATSQDTENVSKATGTTENATNTTSEQTNSVAKDKNAVSSTTSTTAQTKENLSKTTGTAANEKNTISENLNTGAKEKNTLATRIGSVAQLMWTNTVSAARTAWNGFTEALLANPFTAIITAITTIISLVLTFTGILDLFTSSEDDASKSMTDAADNAITKTNTLFAQLQTVDENSQTYRDTVNELTEEYKKYGITLDDTIMKVGTESEKKQELLSHENELIEAIRTEAIERQKANLIEDEQKDYASKSQENFKNSMDLDEDDISDSELESVRLSIEASPEIENAKKAMQDFDAVVEKYGMDSQQAINASYEYDKALGNLPSHLQQLVNANGKANMSLGEATTKLGEYLKAQIATDAEHDRTEKNIENVAKSIDGYNASLKDQGDQAAKTAKDQEKLSYWYDENSKSAQAAGDNAKSFGKDITDWVDTSVAKASQRMDELTGSFGGVLIPGLANVSAMTKESKADFDDLGLSAGNVTMGMNDAGDSANTLGMNIGDATTQGDSFSATLADVYGTAENARAQLEVMVPSTLDPAEAFPELIGMQGEVEDKINWVNSHPTNPQVDAQRVLYLKELLGDIKDRINDINGNIKNLGAKQVTDMITNLKAQRDAWANDTSDYGLKMYKYYDNALKKVQGATAAERAKQEERDAKKAQQRANSAARKRTSTANSAARKAQTEAEQAAQREKQRKDARLKAEESYQKTLSDFIKDEEEKSTETRIKLMKEGAEKEVAQINNNTQKQLDALNERYQKLADARKKLAMTEWINAGGQGKSKRTEQDWNKTAEGKKDNDYWLNKVMSANVGVSDEQLKEIQKWQEKLYKDNGLDDVVQMLRDEFSFGNVDAVSRPVIEAAKLAEKGWKDVGDGVATFYSSSYGIKDDKGKEHEVLVTPILPDGSVLSQKELTDYVNKQLNGKDILKADTKKLVIDLDTDVEGMRGERLHQLSERLTDSSVNGQVMQRYASLPRTNRDFYNEQVNAIQVNQQRELLKAQLKTTESMDDFLKKYGDLTLQKQAINNDYDRQIANETDPWKIQGLNKERQAALTKADIDDISNSMDWGDVFSNFGTLSKELVDPLINRLQTIINSDAFKEQDYDSQSKVYEMLDKLRDMNNVFDKDMFSKLNSSISDYQTSLVKLSKAQEDELKLREETTAAYKDWKDAEEQYQNAMKPDDEGKIDQAKVDQEKANVERLKAIYDEKAKNELSASNSVKNLSDDVKRYSDNIKTKASKIANNIKSVASAISTFGQDGASLQSIGDALMSLDSQFNGGKITNAVGGWIGRLFGKDTLSASSRDLRNQMTSYLKGADGLDKDTITNGLNNLVDQSLFLTDDQKKAIKDKTGKIAEQSAEGNAEAAGQSIIAVLESAGAVSGIWGAIISAFLSLLDQFKEQGLGGVVQALLNSITDALEGIIDNMFDFGTITKQLYQSGVRLAGGVLGSIANGLTGGAFNKWFGIGGNAEEVKKTTEDLTASNDRLNKSVQNLTNEMSKQSGMTATKTYNQAYQDQLKINAQTLDILKAQMGYTGAHHSNRHYWNRDNDKYADDYKQINDLLRGKTYTGATQNSVSSFEDFMKLTPEQMKDIETYLPEVWKLFSKDIGKYDKSEYWENYVDLAGKLEDLTEQINENLTTISFDSMKDNFLSTLMDMNSSTEDFGKKFTKTLTQSMLKWSLDSAGLNDKLKALWKKWADVMRGTYDEEGNQITAGRNLTPEEIRQYQEEYKAIVESGEAIRDQVANITGYKDQYSQSASGGTYQTMSQDVGTELNGRFTAVQTATEGTWKETQQINKKLDTFGGVDVDGYVTALRNYITAMGLSVNSVSDLKSVIEQFDATGANKSDNMLTVQFSNLTANTSQLLGIADEGRTILSQQLLELQEINDRQREWEKPMKAMWTQIKDMRDDIHTKL